MDSDQSSGTIMNIECDYCKERKKCMACEGTLDEIHFREKIPHPVGIQKSDLKIYISGNTYHLFSKDSESTTGRYDTPSIQYSRTFSKPLRVVRIVEEDGHLFVVGEFFTVNKGKQ